MKETNSPFSPGPRRTPWNFFTYTHTDLNKRAMRQRRRETRKDLEEKKWRGEGRQNENE
jgi:hypothetical protein